MPRMLHWKWVGLLALTLTPGLALEQAAAPETHTVRKGDTLWDLANKWLGDPHLWPQVWDQNRYILDSHWIYPGDPLAVPGKPARRDLAIGFSLRRRPAWQLTDQP